MLWYMLQEIQRNKTVLDEKQHIIGEIRSKQQNSVGGKRLYQSIPQDIGLSHPVHKDSSKTYTTLFHESVYVVDMMCSQFHSQWQNNSSSMGFKSILFLIFRLFLMFRIFFTFRILLIFRPSGRYTNLKNLRDRKSVV